MEIRFLKPQWSIYVKLTEDIINVVEIFLATCKNQALLTILIERNKKCKKDIPNNSILFF